MPLTSRGARRLLIALALGLFGHATPRAHAQAADYVGDTHVYDTPARGEVEPECGIL